jgi:hypothetical protein
MKGRSWRLSEISPTQVDAACSFFAPKECTSHARDYLYMSYFLIEFITRAVEFLPQLLRSQAISQMDPAHAGHALRYINSKYDYDSEIDEVLAAFPDFTSDGLPRPEDATSALKSEETEDDEVDDFQMISSELSRRNISMDEFLRVVEMKEREQAFVKFQQDKSNSPRDVANAEVKYILDGMDDTSPLEGEWCCICFTLLEFSLTA